MAPRGFRKALSQRELREAHFELAKLLTRHGDGDWDAKAFQEEACRALLERFRCEAVEIWLRRKGGFDRFGLRHGGGGGVLPVGEAPGVSELCAGLAGGDDPSYERYRHGDEGILLEDVRAVFGERLDPGWRTLALAPFGRTGEGALLLAGSQPGWFSPAEMPALVELAQVVHAGLLMRLPREALSERMKELTCLYGLSKLAQRSELSIGELLKGITALVPPAWQHPELAHCRITCEGEAHQTAGFQESRLVQRAGILVKGAEIGSIEVSYPEDAPGIDREKPFLPEERNLIEGLAREIAIVIERRRLGRDRDHLWEQIQHMDRLATIGQLAASVAHELNEPLCSILGLAQLAIKDPRLPPQAKGDLHKIVASSLHARDVVRGLLGFSRTAPTRKAATALNPLLEDAIGLFATRCARAKVVIRLQLQSDLPDPSIDPSQLRQVLVNLILNAIQAMPKGGLLTVSAWREGCGLVLSVEDTGIGMDDETLRRIFTPFFTTKEVEHGTGLGLNIVQGIVTSMGGALKVESQPGRGSRFTVELPMQDWDALEERRHG